jgi:hypothetical protein
LRNLIFDGYYPWMRVHEECYEARHPQEKLVSVTDPIALYRPAPDLIAPPTAFVLTVDQVTSVHISLADTTVNGIGGDNIRVGISIGEDGSLWEYSRETSNLFFENPLVGMWSAPASAPGDFPTSDYEVRATLVQGQLDPQSSPLDTWLDLADTSQSALAGPSIGYSWEIRGIEALADVLLEIRDKSDSTVEASATFSLRQS